MTTLTDSATPPPTPGRTHPTMTIPTRTKAANPTVMRAARVKGVTYLRRSICCAGPELHPRATRSRDAH